MSLEAGGRMEAIDVSPEMLTLVGIGSWASIGGLQIRWRSR